MLNNFLKYVIAIDGPSASGKSTVARLLASETRGVYVDSGSLYRGITWKALESGINTKDAPAVIDLLKRTNWNFSLQDGAVRFRMDGVDPGLALRSEIVHEHVSDIAAIPEVREFVVEKLREMQSMGSLVMEGRDIGSVVFPNTPYKFYIDADPGERARRRFLETANGRQLRVNAEAVLSSLLSRDQKDSERATAPLKIADGAIVINTTNMALEEVVKMIIGKLREAGFRK